MMFRITQGSEKMDDEIAFGLSEETTVVDLIIARVVEE